MKMQAVIMAGGEGTRLRPLTCDIPKPMARLCGRPVIEYILDLLDSHGINNAAVTLRYLPNVIINHFGGENAEKYKNISLRFEVEEKPLGTAGSVKGAMKDAEPSGDILVISGDALTDFNLTAAAEFHKKTGAAVTLVVTHVDDPREYGLVRTDADGKITGFVEKPGWSQAVSDLANTGIYILSPSVLSHIPDDISFDFAKDLFPLLMSKGESLYAYEDEGYWCDIGSLSTYLSCQNDMLEHRVKGIEVRGTAEELHTAGEMPGVIIVPPVYIGKGVSIAAGAHIGPYAVIDDGCRIGSDTKIKNSVLLESAYAGNRSSLTGAILCHSASVRRGASLFEGSVAGSASVVGEYAAVLSDVKIWPGKTVESNSVLRDNLRDGGGWAISFDEVGLTGETGVELTPEFCARAGAAIGSCAAKADCGKIAVGCSENATAHSLLHALVSGILSTGRDVWNFGGCIQPQFDYFVNFSRISMGIYISGGQKTTIRLVSSGGLPSPRQVERDVESRLATGDFLRCGWENIRNVTDMTGMSQLYLQELISIAPLGLMDISAVVRGADHEAVRLLNAALGTLGCEPDGELRVYLGADGRRLSLYAPEVGYVWPEQTFALSCMIALENGFDISLPYNAPEAIRDIAKQYGRNVTRYYSCPADDSDRKARELAADQLWARDGLMCAIRILYHMKTTGKSITDMLNQLPGFAVTTKTLDCEVNPGKVLRHFSCDTAEQMGEGARIVTESGVIFMRPSKQGKSLILTAEAADAEIAGELCGEIEEQIRSFSLTMSGKESNI